MRARRRAPANPDQLVLNFGEVSQQACVSGPRARERRAAPDGDHVFFAHMVAPVTAARLAGLADARRRQFQLQGATRPVALSHLSLNPVGAYDNLAHDVIAAVKQAASTVDVARFDLTFDRIMSFRSGAKRPLVLRCADGVAAVTALYGAIGAAMAGIGLRRARRSGFTPHVTLLYDAKLIPETILDAPITTTVCDFALVHSLHGQSRHRILGRWPLRG